jgi:hypothetical protein
MADHDYASLVGIESSDKFFLGIHIQVVGRLIENQQI